MTSKVGKVLSSFDQFGALSQMSFLNNDSKFKTVQGGLLSLWIYSLGLLYFLYLIIMWSTYQIQPSVTVQSQFVAGQREFALNITPFVFSLQVNGPNSNVSALEKNGDMFNYEIRNLNISQPLSLRNAAGFECFQPKKGYDFFDPICIDLNDTNQTMLYSNSNNRTEDTYVNFNIKYCDPTNNTNTSCLSFADQTTIFNGQTQWRLTLITQDIDLKTRKIIDIPQDYYFAANSYQNFKTIVLALKITQATYIIDTGILFSNLESKQLVRSVQFSSSVYQVTDPATKTPLIASISYSLDRQEQVVTVTYPKMGQILAELGSIFQTLLLLGLIMNLYNGFWMQIQIEEASVKIYFPQMRIFEFKYNWWGNIDSISIKGEPLKKTQFDEIKKFRKISGKQIMSKLNYMNILHDISKVKIQMQLHLPKQQISKFEDLGYRMNLQSLNQPCPLISSDDKELLDYEDFLQSFSKENGTLKPQNELLIVQDEISSPSQVDSNKNVVPGKFISIRQVNPVHND